MEQTDIVVKQNILLQTAANNPQDALSLCQTDKRFRGACKALPPQTKSDICLRNQETAKECDKVPMYSRAQFLALIPPTIEIVEDDPLQLRHEFYSQNYKLPNEGFAEALYKAKIINTICALIRPRILRDHINEMSPLPAYIDSRLIDRAMHIYNQAVAIAKIASNHVYDLQIEIEANKDNGDTLGMVIHYRHEDNQAYFWVTLSTRRDDFEDLMRIRDPFVSKIYRIRTGEFDDSHLGIKTFTYFKLNEDGNDAPNIFIISRIIYEMLNRGFKDWHLRYLEESRETGKTYLDEEIQL